MSLAMYFVLAVVAIVIIGQIYLFQMVDRIDSIDRIESPSHLGEELENLVVAYAVTITRIEDGTAGNTLVDAIEVLGLSIDAICLKSIYSCTKVAFVSPSVSIPSREPLKALGWILYERGVPVDIDTIRGTKLRDRIDKSGCCGASELIKLWAFTLTEYYRVLHLDIDTLLLQPMDDILNLDVELVYTTDEKMAPSKHNMPVQGGFLLCKPSLDTFNELVSIVQEGDWAPNVGWAKSGIGFFHGGPTIQGLLAYYYRHFKPPEFSFETDRCMYNHMWDTDECRSYGLDAIRSVHYTQSCPKPWVCNAKRMEGCVLLANQWYLLWEQARISHNLTQAEPCKGGKYTSIRN